MKNNRGITLIVLAITISVLIILAGVSIASLGKQKGTIKETKKTIASAEKESLIEKIEADLYTEKVKTGETPSKTRMKEIIKQNEYCKGEPAEDNFISKNGEYTISYDEVVGWK